MVSRHGALALVLVCMMAESASVHLSCASTGIDLSCCFVTVGDSRTTVVLLVCSHAI